MTTPARPAPVDLVEHFAPIAYRLAYGILGPGGTEEIVQEVCLELVRRAATFDRGKAPTISLYRVILAALARRRGAIREAFSIEDFLPTYDATGHRQGDQDFLVADWSGTTTEALLSGERRLIVQSAFRRLPVDDRIIVLLCDVEELSSEEVAEILGSTSDSIKFRLHRARMALRELLTSVFRASPARGSPWRPSARLNASW